MPFSHRLKRLPCHLKCKTDSERRKEIKVQKTLAEAFCHPLCRDVSAPRDSSAIASAASLSLPACPHGGVGRERDLACLTTAQLFTNRVVCAMLNLYSCSFLSVLLPYHRISK